MLGSVQWSPGLSLLVAISDWSIEVSGGEDDQPRRSYNDNGGAGSRGRRGRGGGGASRRRQGDDDQLVIDSVPTGNNSQTEGECSAT